MTENDIARIDHGQSVGFIPKSNTPYIDGKLVGYISRIYPASSQDGRQGKILYKDEIEFPVHKPVIYNSSCPSFSLNIKGKGQILIFEKPIIQKILKFN